MGKSDIIVWHVTGGVPQGYILGYILGSLLFIIYINDLSKVSDELFDVLFPHMILMYFKMVKIMFIYMVTCYNKYAATIPSFITLIYCIFLLCLCT